MNSLCIIGNMTRDAEVKAAGKGTVAKFGIAWNERVPDGNGGWADKAHFFDVECWNGAEAIGKYTDKGSKVAISGELSYHAWQTDDGAKRSKVFIKAQRVEFLDRKKDGGEPDAFAQAKAFVDAHADDDDIPF